MTKLIFMNTTPAIRWEPLGDQAVMALCPDESTAFRLAACLRERRLPWAVDIVQAYVSVATFYDPACVSFAQARHALAEAWTGAGESRQARPARLHVIPCCYELGLDLERVAGHVRRSVQEVIELHGATAYTVYAIGFCPGFPYLGYLPEALQGVPRLPAPRVRVEAGSVGLTGKQTGIYTEARPGGWNILGRTPLELVNVADGYFPLRTGDEVRFRAIDKEEYRALEGRRL